MRRLAGILIVGALLAPVAASAQNHPRSTVWRDDFSGTQLDLTKWQPNWLGATNATITPPVNGAELSCYDPSQVSVAGGYLHLRAIARSCTDKNGRTYPYASGLVNSRQHFTYTYGTLRARVWLPGSGAVADDWPAVWADGIGQWPSTGENDVLEVLDGHNCYHFHSPAGGPGGCARQANPAGWHTIAANWRPGKVNYWYDGVKVGSITSGLTSAPMFVILNLALSASVSPPVKVPTEMLVDWVEVDKNGTSVN
jgi:beta-glucanase (GH16 family)